MTESMQGLLDALLAATVFCEAPATPGVMSAQTPDGPVVCVFSSLDALARARGAVPWFATTGQDLLRLLPPGHDLLLDAGEPHAVRLVSAALAPGVAVGLAG